MQDEEEKERLNAACDAAKCLAYCGSVDSDSTMKAIGKSGCERLLNETAPQNDSNTNDTRRLAETDCNANCDNAAAAGIAALAIAMLAK